MTLRRLGTLARWNDERGFGFITPQSGGDDVFVHISAFPRGQKPVSGEHLSFELETTPDGRSRAVRVILPDRLQLVPAVPRTSTSSTNHAGPATPHTSRPSHRPTHSRRATFPAGRVLLLVAVVIAGAFGYGEYRKNMQQERSSQARIYPATSGFTQPSSFQCDGRTHCNQMRSCEEATFFLRNCPNTKMDGNRDGVPCERQWCR